MYSWVFLKSWTKKRHIFYSIWNHWKKLNHQGGLIFFGPEQPVKGCWRYLYKLPINKRTGDLQCRIIHGAIATNKHVAHIDPYQSVDFPFCSQMKHWYIRFVVATGWDFCSIYRNNGVFFGKNVFLFLCLFLDQSILSIRNKNKCWWILSLEWLNFLYGFQGRI